MKTKLLFSIIALNLTACASWKYPNWEYVRIESTVPPDCVYRIQEACSLPANKCLNWHKQRATKFDANTVVIQKEVSMNEYATSFWSGRMKGGEQSSTLAEYYWCVGDKLMVGAK
ncbi:MAG: hypothetical protein WC967_13515 [Balneolaceae bacterium]